MPYNSYAYVLNHLNLAIARKKLRIKFKHTRKTQELVKALFDVGYVNSYTITTTPSLKPNTSPQKWIYVSPTFYKNTPFFKSVRLVSTPTKKHTVSLNGLRTLKKALRSSTMVLSTPYGIVSHNEALRIETGGIILCVMS